MTLSTSGPKEFSCPNCHLNKIELLGKTNPFTCGTRGKLVILPNQDIRLGWEESRSGAASQWKGN